MRKSYSVLSRGHAPEHIRGPLIDLMERALHDGWWVFAGQGRVLGRLWNCTDQMPGDVCHDLEMDTGSYAQVVRKLKRILVKSGIVLEKTQIRRGAMRTPK